MCSYIMLDVDYNIVSVNDYVFFFKQKTAYEMRISDWSSDVCSSDLSAMNTAGTTMDSRLHRPSRQARTIACARHRGPATTYCRATIIFLISAMAFAGLSPFGQVLVQFMMVWQR